ncbi:hypothetical protein JSS1_006 [Salmonella phage JSS1]|uniref:Fusion protein n=1 Tax=Salmonella phage JSS1 TaxID=2972748 RepID=A0AAE9NJS1_9CAUD|nr:hypothetical protein JSS1_006 [Salmonella phage JSS1]
MFTFIATTTAIISTTLAIVFLKTGKQVNDQLNAAYKERKVLKENLAEGHSELASMRNYIERYKRETESDMKFESERTKAIIADHVARNKELRERIKTLEKFRDDIMFSDITSIKFTAHIPDAGWKRTEFKLGIWSCGKQVTCLHWEEQSDRYLLTQTCTDGERKELTYYKKDVAGRIEIARKVADNTTH